MGVHAPKAYHQLFLGGTVRGMFQDRNTTSQRIPLTIHHHYARANVYKNVQTAFWRDSDRVFSPFLPDSPLLIKVYF